MTALEQQHSLILNPSTHGLCLGPIDLLNCSMMDTFLTILYNVSVCRIPPPL